MDRCQDIMGDYLNMLHQCQDITVGCSSTLHRCQDIIGDYLNMLHRCQDIMGGHLSMLHQRHGLEFDCHGRSYAYLKCEIPKRLQFKLHSANIVHNNTKPYRSTAKTIGNLTTQKPLSLQREANNDTKTYQTIEILLEPLLKVSSIHCW